MAAVVVVPVVAVFPAEVLVVLVVLLVLLPAGAAAARAVSGTCVGRPEGGRVCHDWPRSVREHYPVIRGAYPRQRNYRHGRISNP